AAQRRGVAILVLSAMTGSDDRVEGLGRGADDYMPKPVDLRELSLRIAKLLERRGAETGGGVRIGRASIDSVRRQAYVDEEAVKLTRTQCSVLEYLFLRSGRPVSTEELLEHVWDSNFNPLSNAVGPQITRLRQAFRGALEFRNRREIGYEVFPIESADDTGSENP